MSIKPTFRLRTALCAPAIFWLPVDAAHANCRVEADHYGGGTTTTQCNDGYVAHEEKDHYGGHSISGSDNQGHRWTIKKSPWGGPDTIEEH